MYAASRLLLAALICAASVAVSASETKIRVDGEPITESDDPITWYYDDMQNLLFVSTDPENPARPARSKLDFDIVLLVDDDSHPDEQDPLTVPTGQEVLFRVEPFQGLQSCSADPDMGSTPWKNLGDGFVIGEPNPITINHVRNQAYRVCCNVLTAGSTANVEACGTAWVQGDDTADPVDPEEPPSSGGGPEDSCSKPTVARDVTTWADEFGGQERVEWPNRNDVENFVFAPPANDDGDGKAVAFTTDNVDRSGTISNILRTSTAKFQKVSISPCQADWGEGDDEFNENCRWQGNSSSFFIRWTTRSEPGEGVCPLAKNTTYYVNFGFTGDCGGLSCFHRIGLTIPTTP